MILSDINAHIGNWPFRPLAITTVTQLLKKMDQLNIKRAAVANTHSIFYLNPHRGNTELFDQIKKYPERLYGVATLNPLYINALQDLTACRNEFGFKALRLVPAYHNFLLNSAESLAFAKAAGRLGMTIIVPNRIVDVRQRHWIDVERTVELDELIAFSKSLADTEIIAVEFALDGSDETIAKLKTVPNLSFDISRLHTLWPRDLPRLIKELTNKRFLFGTGMGFKVCQNGLLRIAALNNEDDIKYLGQINFTKVFCSE